MQRGQPHQSRPTLAELLGDRLAMGLDGTGGYPEPLAKLFVGEPLAEDDEHLELAGREPRRDLLERVRLIRIRATPADGLGDRGEQRVRGVGLVDDRHNASQEIQRTDEVLHAAGNHDALQARVTGPHRSDEIHAVAGGEPQIHDQQVDVVERRE